MEQEANKAVVRQFFDASTRGDIAAMVSCWAADAINHGRFTEGDANPNRPPAGSEGLRRVFQSLHTAFPDRDWKIDHLLAADDFVVARLTVSGTHQGTPDIPVEGGPLLQQIIPVGESYTVLHIHIFRVADGKIVEHWAARDDLGLIEQLSRFADSRRAKSEVRPV